MPWLGKILGVIFGFWLLNIVGAILGFIIGHVFDVRRARQQIKMAFTGNSEVQQVFFNAVFSAMGHLSKIDGRVTEKEVSAARGVMMSMQLNDQQKKQAIERFNQGKQSGYDLYHHLAELRQVSRGNKSLLRVFLQFQFKAAYADGQPSKEELRVLGVMAETLGFGRFEFEQMHTLFKAQSNFDSRRHSYQQSGQSRSSTWSGRSQLSSAYKALGVSSSASKDEVKKAYRKLINEYHPDKLVAKGLPEAMMKVATEKTQEIKTAYDAIKKAKGW